MRADTLGLRIALGATIGLVLVYLVAVHTASGQHVDDLMMSILARSDAGWAEAVLAVVSPTSVLVATLTIKVMAALVGGVRPRWPPPSQPPGRWWRHRCSRPS